MMRRLCLVLVVLIFIKCITSQLTQERATVNYCNPKYITECYALTRRSRRGEPYKTNFTLTTRYTNGNNLTARVVMFGGLTAELMKARICDVTHIDWLYEYLKIYSNMHGDCPYKAGSYGLFNMEFPPKNTPQRIRNLLKGKFRVKLYLQATLTEETLCELTITVYALS